MAHVGETGHAMNVVKAINFMGVTDVCHGIQLANPARSTISDDRQLNRLYFLDLVRDAGIHFHMSITPNYLTGVLHDQTWHPIVEFLDRDVKVTLGTDDPVVCNSTLDGEFERARLLGISAEKLEVVRRTAVDRTEQYLGRRLPDSRWVW